MKHVITFCAGITRRISRPSLFSLLFIFFLIGVIILNYIVEVRQNESGKAHNRGSEMLVKHEQYKHEIDKVTFSLTQIDNELGDYLLTGDNEKLRAVYVLMESMNRNLTVVRNEAAAHIPKYLVNLFLHKVRNRLDYQNSVLRAFQQNGRKGAMQLINNPEDKKTSSEYYSSETELTAALNQKIGQLNTIQLEQEKAASKLDAYWNIVSLIFLLLIAVVVLYQTTRIGKLNSDLQMAVVKMKHATRVKDQFMSNITHELRTPLNSILGYTNLLLKRRHEPESEKWIQAVNSSGTMLLDIINDVLDYSKLESGYLHISNEAFHLDDVLTNLKNIMGNRAETKGLSFVILKDQSLPSSLLGDERKLKQILINLTGNALKFTEKGTVKVEVMLHKQLAEQYWLEFKVSDTGIGINAESLPNIFERFYQVENSYTKNYTGTGLGLPIVKQLIDLQGGTITVNSVPNAGTAFTFVLPFVKAEMEAEKAITNLAPVRSMLQSSMKKILVVDDHELNRDLLVLLLQEYNCNVTTAENGKQAIELLHHHQFHLVLMDVQMPELNGIETTQIIRNHLTLDVPVIACTAFSQPSEKQACINAGMNDYLGKPVNENELLQLLSRYLDLKVTENSHHLIVDFKQIQRVTGTNKKLTATVLERAIELVPGELDQLYKAIVNGDKERINELSHTMCSTLGLMGAPPSLSEKVKQLEYGATESIIDRKALLKIFDEINETVQQMIAELKNYLAA